MKKIILALTMVGLLGTSQVQTARANGGAVAAGVIGGLAAGTVIGATIAHPYYYAPAPVYSYYPPGVTYSAGVVYQPPCPVVVYAPRVYVPAPPVVTFGFGFGPRPVFRTWGRWDRDDRHWHR